MDQFSTTDQLTQTTVVDVHFTHFCDLLSSDDPAITDDTIMSFLKGEQHYISTTTPYNFYSKDTQQHLLAQLGLYSLRTCLDTPDTIDEAEAHAIPPSILMFTALLQHSSSTTTLPQHTPNMVPPALYGRLGLLSGRLVGAAIIPCPLTILAIATAASRGLSSMDHRDSVLTRAIPDFTTRFFEGLFAETRMVSALGSLVLDLKPVAASLSVEMWKRSTPSKTTRVSVPTPVFSMPNNKQVTIVLRNITEALQTTGSSISPSSLSSIRTLNLDSLLVDGTHRAFEILSNMLSSILESQIETIIPSEKTEVNRALLEQRLTAGMVAHSSPKHPLIISRFRPIWKRYSDLLEILDRKIGFVSRTFERKLANRLCELVSGFRRSAEYEYRLAICLCLSFALGSFAAKNLEGLQSSTKCLSFSAINLDLFSILGKSNALSVYLAVPSSAQFILSIPPHILFSEGSHVKGALSYLFRVRAYLPSVAESPADVYLIDCIDSVRSHLQTMRSRGGDRLHCPSPFLLGSWQGDVYSELVRISVKKLLEKGISHLTLSRHFASIFWHRWKLICDTSHKYLSPPHKTTTSRSTPSTPKKKITPMTPVSSLFTATGGNTPSTKGGSGSGGAPSAHPRPPRPPNSVTSAINTSPHFPPHPQLSRLSFPPVHKYIQYASNRQASGPLTPTFPASPSPQLPPPLPPHQRTAVAALLSALMSWMPEAVAERISPLVVEQCLKDSRLHQKLALCPSPRELRALLASDAWAALSAEACLDQLAPTAPLGERLRSMVSDTIRHRCHTALPFLLPPSSRGWQGQGVAAAAYGEGMPQVLHTARELLVEAACGQLQSVDDHLLLRAWKERRDEHGRALSKPAPFFGGDL